jgi:hypothetical protein
VPIAVFCNVIRVTLMGVSSEWLHAEADRLAEGAATWSAYAPRFTAWSGLAWVGLVALVAGVFLLVMRGGEEKLARIATPRRTAGLALAGAVLIALTSGLHIGYETPAQLEEVRRIILNPKSGPHQAFGFAMLGLAFALMWLELRFIDLFFVEEPDPAQAEAPGAGGPSGKAGPDGVPEG